MINFNYIFFLNKIIILIFRHNNIILIRLCINQIIWLIFRIILRNYRLFVNNFFYDRFLNYYLVRFYILNLRIWCCCNNYRIWLWFWWLEWSTVGQLRRWICYNFLLVFLWNILIIPSLEWNLCFDWGTLFNRIYLCWFLLHGSLFLIFLSH